MRICGYYVSTAWDFWQTKQEFPEMKDHYFRMNGIKAWSDGSTQGGSAYFRDPYLLDKWGNGFANYSQ